MIRHFWVVIACLIVVIPLRPAQAQEVSVWQTGENIRSTLFDAQRLLFTTERADDPEAIYAEAQALLDRAVTAYMNQLQPTAVAYSPEAATAVTEALSHAQHALDSENPILFAAARGRIWTNLLWTSYAVVEGALAAGDISAVQMWLPLREYREATRVNFVESLATRAVRTAAEQGFISDETVVMVLNDLRDTYYFRLRDALNQMDAALTSGYATRVAEWAGQAQGYFNILHADYAAKLGESQAAAAIDALAGIEAPILEQDWDAVSSGLAALSDLLIGYQPVELSPDLVAERGRLLYLFVDLIYTEYRDGVRGGEIVIPIEYQEAVTFHDQAVSIFTELRPVIAAADSLAADRLAALLDEIDAVMAELGDREQVQAMVEEVLVLVETALDVRADSADTTAVFTIIDTLLDQIVTSVQAGRYDDAERARLEAYAMFEGGPEQRLVHRAPVMSRELEGLFWEGTGGQQGLAMLLQEEASLSTVEESVARLRARLTDAESFLAAGLSDTLAAANSAIIIIREGLEAVLIIGAILGYLRATSAPRKYSRWMYIGVGSAIALSILTWWAAQSLIAVSVSNREMIEGAASLIAVVVLFYVTNWLFHKVYVIDWMTFVKDRVGQAMTTGSALALAGLGFTVVYREGFETVLFYQALLFDAEPASVLIGFLVGAVIILGVTYAILQMSRRIPLKPFFLVTTILLLLLAFNFTGTGIRELQEAGVVSATLLSGLPEDLILMEVFGLFPTVETTLGQAIFVAAIALTFGLSHWQGRRTHAAAGQG